MAFYQQANIKSRVYGDLDSEAGPRSLHWSACQRVYLGSRLHGGVTTKIDHKVKFLKDSDSYFNLSFWSSPI